MTDINSKQPYDNTKNDTKRKRDHISFFNLTFNMTNLQYLWYYSLSDTFSIGAAPNIIINWEQDSGNKITVPLGIGFNSTVNIGKVPVRFGAELHYSVIKPDDVLGTKWDFRFYIIPAVPSALFGWMQ